MENNLLLKNSMQKIERGEATDFMEMPDATLVIRALAKKHINCQLFKPFPDAEKVIIYDVNPPRVSVLKIISKMPLTHPEILGTLFSHNIVPSKYGDIIVGEECYLIVLDTLKDYLISHLHQIGKKKISLEEVSLSKLAHFHYQYDELHLLVSSLRLDSVLAIITHSSRSQTEMLFTNKDILVNYNPHIKKTYLIKEDDIISIRHYGKYIYKGIMKMTNRNRYVIKVLKYK